MGRLAEISADIAGLAIPVSSASEPSSDGRYDQIAKSYWRRFESDDEHADRVEAATNEAYSYFIRATERPLKAYRQAMEDARPYRGAPKWDRMKAAAADRAWEQETSSAYDLFLRCFEEIMRDDEISESSLLRWDALYAGQNNPEIAA